MRHRAKTANWRLILIILVTLALAPVTWIRAELPPPDLNPPVNFIRLAMPQLKAGEVQLIGGWKLVSTNDHFGGYSALIALDDQHLIAVSDRRRIMRLALRKTGPPVVQMDYLSGKVQPEKRLTDVEAITRDPVSGRFWIGYEQVNAIERLDSDLNQSVSVRPDQMQEWSANKGAEAMTRLADGRFILLAEGSQGWFKKDFPGLLFPSDPVAGVTAEEFRFAPPEGYRPVDMVEIPGGNVLILVRKVHWKIMPRFTAKLVLADPAAIVPDGTWSGRVIAEFAPPIPSDNFEGLAVWPRDDGLLDLWMISDDNRAGFQSTYLLKMRWDPQSRAAPAR